jgi:hypothetical protein
MKRKKKLPRADAAHGIGTYIRFPAATRTWLSSKARSEGDRSVSSIVREIVEQARAAEATDAAQVERVGVA